MDNDRRDFLKVVAAAPLAFIAKGEAKPFLPGNDLMTVKIGTITLTKENTFTTHGFKWAVGVDEFVINKDSFSAVLLSNNEIVDSFKLAMKDGTLLYITGENGYSPDTIGFYFYLRGYVCSGIDYFSDNRVRLWFHKDKTLNRS